jgi:pfkB family carbohydrate kinase
VIVVVGAPAWRDADPPGPAGLACEIAVAAAARGRRVELVGRIGDDPSGDALLIALNRAGVGHAAVLRDPTRATPVAAPTDPADAAHDLAADAPPTPPTLDGPRLEPADVSLALSYLTAFSVLVVTDDVGRAALPETIDGAAFAEAHLVLLIAPGAPAPDGLPAASTVLGVPGAGEAGAFGTVVGVYADGLDAGLDPGRAFRAAIGDWEPADEDEAAGAGAGAAG